MSRFEELLQRLAQKLLAGIGKDPSSLPGKRLNGRVGALLRVIDVSYEWVQLRAAVAIVLTLRLAFVRRPAHIEKPPGMRSLAIIRFLFSARTVEKVFNPIIAGYQTEVFDALKQQGSRHAKVRYLKGKYAGVLFIAAFGTLVSALVPIKPLLKVSSLFAPPENGGKGGDE